jgi:hypothetical protein
MAGRVLVAPSSNRTFPHPPMNRSALSALALSAAFFLGSGASQAQDRRPPGGGPEGGGRGGQGLESMTPEEREKLRAVHQRLQQNEKVRVAEAAMQEASRNLRSAREEAMAALALTDPSLEPILKKLREAGQREGEGGRRRGEGEGDAPRRVPGGAQVPRSPREPGTGEPQTRRPERPERTEGDRPPGPRPRPEAREGDRPSRPEGDRPVRPEAAREGSREEGTRPQAR